MTSETEWKTFANDKQYKSPSIGTADDTEWMSDFYFVLGTDPQFGLIGCSKQNTTSGTCNWDEEIRLSTLAVEKVNKLNPKPRFFLICGDLTHEMPGSKNENPEIREQEIADFKKVFSKLDSSIPLICVSGNHDVGDNLTEEALQNYRNHYGDDYFSFWCGGKLFIVLNSQYYKDLENFEIFHRKQEEWLNDQLNKNKSKNIIVFSHIPPFINYIEEADGIFNFPKKIRSKFLDKLYDAGVKYLFCGHYHRNAYTHYKDMKIIVTSAIGLQLGSDKSGLRIVKVSKNEVIHKYFALEDVPEDVCDIFDE